MNSRLRELAEAGGQWEEIEVTGVKSERADRLLAAFILSREGFSARL